MLRLALLAALLPACAETAPPPDPDPTPTEVDPAPKPDRPDPPTEVDSNRSTEVASQPRTPPKATERPDPPPPKLAPQTPVPGQIDVKRITAAKAEDGSGKTIAPAAGSAVAIDLHFGHIPGRALDPVLEIGGATFHDYQILPGGIMRFVVASPALAEGGEVVLRWGRDVTVVASQLKVGP